VARVLITGFCAVPAPRRAGVQLRHVVRALSARHQVDVLVVRDGDQAYVERQGNVRILRVPTHNDDPAAQIQAFQRALRRQLEGADYDVVHCRDSWSAVTALGARGRLGYAVVFDLTRAPLGDVGVLDPDLQAVAQRDDEACLSEADLVLAPTEPARRYAAARNRPERVALSPPGVDVDRFDWDDAPPGPPRILYTGTLEPNRGVRVLVRAMVDVARVSDARLVMAGPFAPGFDAIVAGGVRDLGLADRVELVGPVDHDDMPALIASATICVAPAAAEVAPRPTALYPTKILEYLACRRAVVAARRGTVAMLLDHGREGLTFSPGEPDDLARKLVRLLEDAPLRERLAAAGYDRVRREFTASAARRAVKAAYEQLADRPAFRPRFLEARTVMDSMGRPRAVSEPGGVADDELDGADDTSASNVDAAPEGSLSLDAALDSLDGTRADLPPTDERPPAAAGEPSTNEGLDAAAWPRGRPDAWVVAPVRRATPVGDAAGGDARPPRPHTRFETEEDGTPVDVVPAPAGPAEVPSFVAGEIDVPTPPPEVEVGGFTAASILLGGRGGSDESTS